MRRIGILILCAALIVSGCDSGSGGGVSMSSGSLDDAFAGIILGTVIVVGVTATAIYKHQHRNFERYQPGLNLIPDKKVRAGKAFRVRAIVANEKGKAVKSEWDGTTVRWSIAPTEGDATPVEPTTTKRLAGATAAEFVVEAPGAYRVAFKEWAKDADPKTAAPQQEGTVEVKVE